MRKIVFAAATLLLFTPIFVFGQRTCASYEHLQDQMRNDPAFARKVREGEKSFSSYIRQSGKPTKITVPVVVHVVYNTPEQNISDQQVQSQIDVLNEDFTASNKDYRNYDAGYGSVKGDPDIEFCLVQTRHVSTKRKVFGTEDGVKKTRQGGDDAIDPMHILNIWACNLGQNLLGYAQFPGGPAETFGIVILYSAFGRGSQFDLLHPYDLGRTATHEIGHCLGLRHIWGDATCGNDFVDDTPLHNAANFGCPPEGHRSTCTGTPLEMWMNYMDYTDDRCMYFFTDGQTARAGYFMDTDPQLHSIVTSSCTTISTNTLVSSPTRTTYSSRLAGNEFAVYPSITRGQVIIEMNSAKNGLVTLNVFNLSGALVIKQQLGVVEGMNTKTLDLTGLQDGVYVLQMNQNNTNRVNKLVVQH